MKTTASIIAPSPPKTKKGRILYGVFAGLVCMLMRSFGVFEESVCFAVLLANALCEQFDKIHLPSFGKKEPEKAPLTEEEFERITDTSFIDVGEAPSAGGAQNG